MPGGRPTDYNEAILSRAREYLNLIRPNENEAIPSIEGLALYLGISRPTVYDWAKQEDKKEFSYIVEDILSNQGRTLINKGLLGQFNPTIAKLLLSKHGYADKQELTGKDGEKLDMGVVILPSKNESTLETST